MATGDVVNGISAVNTAFSFQPAVGVEVILTHISNNDQWAYLGTGAGAGFGYLMKFATLSNYAAPVIESKICINNTNFIHFAAGAGIQSSYSGIQIK